MIKSMFFNSSGQDRTYDSADFSQYFGQLVSNGVFYATPENLLVTPASGMKVIVAAGSAFISGYLLVNTSNLELTLTTAHGAQPRIDRIVVRWSLPDRAMTIAVLTGAPAAQPAATVLTRNSSIYELGIADILVPAAALTIPAPNITDTRANPTLCSFVNSHVSATYI
ncbi:hypothetical protein FACS1894184_12640 [Clostridia bacterium]|nr:hypothetical protein FACS1894184_12640 [Clostridia bacterium]